MVLPISSIMADGRRYRAYANGESANGIALVPSGDNGVDIYNGEYSNTSVRPRFEVQYYD